MNKPIQRTDYPHSVLAGVALITLALCLGYPATVHAYVCANAAGTDSGDDKGLNSRLACGASAVADGGNGTAVGTSATVTGFDGTALGQGASAGQHSTALGRNAEATGEKGTAVGRDASASTQSTALGQGATANGFKRSTALGEASLSTGEQSSAVGASAEATDDQSTAVGSFTTASGTSSTALGAKADASEFSSTAVGQSATASGNRSTAVGASATTSGVYNTSLGFDADAPSPHTNATAIGYRALVQQSNTMVLGSIPGVNDPFDNTEYVDVGIGTTTPMAALHVRRQDHSLPAQVVVEDLSVTTQNRLLLDLINNGNARFGLENTDSGTRYEIGTTGVNGNFAVFNDGTPLFSLTNTGRFRIGTSAPAQFDSFPNGNLVIQGTLTENSDVNVKQDIEPLQGQRVLQQLAQLPVSEWAYKTSPDSRHIGPMAQDFHKAFGLGHDETKISPRDMAGVALAAIKALKSENNELKAGLAEKDAEISSQREEIVALRLELRQSVEALKTRLNAVEAQNPMIKASVQ